MEGTGNATRAGVIYTPMVDSGRTNAGDKLAYVQQLQEPPVLTQISRMHDDSAALDEALKALEARLSPLLLPPNETTGADAKGCSEPRCELLLSLESLRDKSYRQRRVISNILERLQV